MFPYGANGERVAREKTLRTRRRNPKPEQDHELGPSGRQMEAVFRKSPREVGKADRQRSGNDQRPASAIGGKDSGALWRRKGRCRAPGERVHERTVRR